MSNDRRSSVCVVGSINMDLVMRVPRFPAPGETLMGGPFQRIPGGKGANQAVAAARFGAQVEMIGCVGNDEFGPIMRGVLRNEGIGVSHVATDDEAHTGVAQIVVDAAGENQIIVAPGANHRLNAGHIADDVISNADVVLFQLEVPMAIVARAASIAAAARTRVVLNAAPAASIPPEIAKLIDVLVVNESEAAAISGLPTDSSPSTMAAALEEQGFETTVITLGAKGAYARNDGVEFAEATPIVDVVDTVGAGDAFTGVIAASLARHDDLATAMRFASAAGAIAVTRHGAIPSLPRFDEIESLAATLA
ncbi:MAG: ribokinase [Phycisphaerales bacterium]|nr:ribokinase [Phycisphaerales bacterium]MCB9863169.1 ribokinase [Phycisphaerales bacterium]